MSVAAVPASPLYFLDLEVPGLPDIQSFRARGGRWKGYRHDKRWKEAVRVYLLQHKLPVKPLERANLECIRFSSRAPDHDGLVMSFKPIVDALKPAGGFRGVIADDSPRHVQRLYRWAQCEPSKGRIRVLVSECQP